jgi:hypothetical protein
MEELEKSKEERRLKELERKEEREKNKELSMLNQASV